MTRRLTSTERRDRAQRRAAIRYIAKVKARPQPPITLRRTPMSGSGQ